MRYILLFCFSAFALQSQAQTFSVKLKDIFKPQNKRVLLLSDSADNRLIMFKSNLQVNTDGAPNSYHPYDLFGRDKALNTILNAVAIYRVGENKNLCLSKSTSSEAIKVFESFRDSNFEIVPNGYLIKWQNVLIPKIREGKIKPCIIKTGKYKGYFASSTSLKQGMEINKGECECDNQTNSLVLPGLVLPGGKSNPLRRFGATLGDLIVAYNPENGQVAYGLVNDFGPQHNLGEGSIALNMCLMNKTELPTCRKDLYKLTTNSNILVMIIPASKGIHLKTPYTAANVKERVVNILAEMNIRGEEHIRTFFDARRASFN